MRQSKFHGRPLRTVLALSVAVIALAMLGALGGVGFAKSSLTAAQYQYGKVKVTICHKGKTIKVAKPSLKGHLKHGDTLGACASDKRKGKNKAKVEREHDKAESGAAKAKERAEHAKEKAEHEAAKADERAKAKAEHEAEKAKEHAEKRAEQAEKRAEHEAAKAEREAEKAKGNGKGK